MGDKVSRGGSFFNHVKPLRSHPTGRCCITFVFHSNKMWPLAGGQNTAMNLISSLVSGILRTVIKLAFLVFTALFVLTVLAIGISVALLTVLWSLVTGRKPALATNFTRFRQAAQPFAPGTWARPTTHADSAHTDIVDVQAREVPAALGAPGHTKHAE